MPTKPDLTRKAIGFIDGYFAKTGNRPTIREVQAALGHKSTQTTHVLLRKLRDQGLVDFDSRPRTLKVVQK